MSALPSLYIPHGGGPCFFMEWTMGPADLWDNMQRWLENLASTLSAQPQSILLISAHWEEAGFSVTSGAQPDLIYDYHGFPEHTYQLQYPAPGNPELAAQVCELLSAANMPCRTDAERGFDHGTFIPLKLIYPRADVPVVQLSLNSNLDPAQHLAVGEALTPLRQQGVLIIGSGMSFHNMNAAQFPHSAAASEAFDHWLSTALSRTGPERANLLCNWQSAPEGRFSHPREEHLMPLLVAAGAAFDEPGSQTLRDSLGGNIVSAFQFG